MPRLPLLIGIATLWGCAQDIRPEDQAASSATMGPSASSGSSGGSGTTDAAESTSSDSGATGGSDESGTSSSGEPGDSSTGEPETGAPEIDWPETPCVADNDGAYVLGRTETLATELHDYNPLTGTFSLAFELQCLDAYPFEGPVSLAVGRDGQAFLAGAEPGTVLRFPVVGTQDPCAEIQAQRWSVPGGYASLAFRSEDLFDADTERLFAHGADHHLTGWFGEVFPFAKGFPVSIFDSSSRDYTDLAGTGDGQLFAVSYAGELLVLTSTYYGGGGFQGSPNIGDREFFAWGGALWIFDAPQGPVGTSSSGIYRFALDGTEAYELMTPASEVPVAVLSATTSTCAPTVFGG